MGIDIFASARTPILAIEDGVVTVATWDERPGWYLAIEHEGGWHSLYLHLDGREPRWRSDRRGAQTAFVYSIEVGSVVSAGDVIGYMGTSGNAQRQPPHTHFEMSFNGEPVDPYPFVESALLAAQIEVAIDRGVSPFR
jgi:murein DD-endopeptidase MepM/ murein hydrolase activator NlpD